MSNPFVSTASTALNRLASLGATAESVYCQTMEERELIVANDGSARATVHHLVLRTNMRHQELRRSLPQRRT
jgi:hypothetical protein